MNVHEMALTAHERLQHTPSQMMRDQILDTAICTVQIDIWISMFQDDLELLLLLQAQLGMKEHP